MLSDIAEHGNRIWNWFWNYKIHFSLTSETPVLTIWQITLINIVIGFVGTTIIIILVICVDPQFEVLRQRVVTWIKKGL